MGIFSFLRVKTSGPREIKENERILGDRRSRDENRRRAIQELAALKSVSAAAALLKRFDWDLESATADEEEKELCLHAIVGAGEAAIEPVLAYSRNAVSLIWPTRVLRALITDEQQLTRALLRMLNQFDTDFVRNADPKVQAIQALGAYRSEEVRVALERFLLDMNERVRSTAALSIFQLNDPASAAALISALRLEESPHMQKLVVEGLVDRAWTIPSELWGSLVTLLPPGFMLEKGRVRKV